jgi:hypothetical protein
MNPRRTGILLALAVAATLPATAQARVYKIVSVTHDSGIAYRWSTVFKLVRVE